MMMSMSAVGASAASYCGGANESLYWLTHLNGKKLNANQRLVKTIGPGNKQLGRIFATYSPSAGVYCTSNGDECRSGYARVGSGGKYKESKPHGGAGTIGRSTGYVKLKNKNARFEGWYTY